MVDPIQRGARWQAFWQEEGGLSDMFAEIKGTYLERLAKVPLHDTEQMQILATAHRVTEQLEAMVRSIVSNGEVAERAKEYTTKIQALPAEKRRRL